MVFHGFMFLCRMIQKLSEDGVARCKMSVQLSIDTKLSPRKCTESVAARVHVLPDVEAGCDNDECWRIADELCKQEQDAASVLCCGELQGVTKHMVSVCFRHRAPAVGGRYRTSASTR